MPRLRWQSLGHRWDARNLKAKWLMVAIAVATILYTLVNKLL